MTAIPTVDRRALLLAAATLSLAAAPAGSQSAVASTEANKAVVRSLIERVQRDGDFDLFEKLFAADYVDHTPFGDVPPNRDGTRTIYQAFRAAFPDWRAEIHAQIAEGDLVTSRKTYHGTHRGEFMGVPATGRQTAFQVIDIMRVRGGQITDHWGFGDGAGLMRQIGAQP